MLDGFDFFIIGVANPLIAKDFSIDATEKGLVSAAAIVGAIFGAGLLGPLGDKLGRRRIFKLRPDPVRRSSRCCASWRGTSGR